jgi:DNA repair photolyase
MSDRLLFPMPEADVVSVRRKPRWVETRLRGPILRPSLGINANPGVLGLDLTAGCAHGCPFCYIRSSPLYPGEHRVMYDTTISRRLEWTLDSMSPLPKLVVLSPASDPFPPHRPVRTQAERAIKVLLERRIEVLLMTRGRIPQNLIETLAEHRERVRVAIALTSLDRDLSRTLEPAAAPPWARIERIARLVKAGVRVEVRLEPLVPDVTDTRENIKPLFEALTQAGVRRAVTHYLFLHSAMIDSLKDALRPLDLADKLDEDFRGGPWFSLGTLGSTRHLPRETRQAGFARLSAWGAECGLSIETGATQNPDLPRSHDSDAGRPTVPGPTPRSGRPTSSARLA